MHIYIYIYILRQYKRAVGVGLGLRNLTVLLVAAFLGAFSAEQCQKAP